MFISSSSSTRDHSINEYSQIMQFPLVADRPTNMKFNTNVETAPNCPRCASSNTKFCYYNNYSFTQPRYFCKGCRRYWTKGGSLRNVPVGGGCRKSRRSRARQNGSTSCPTPGPSNEHVGFTSDIDLAAVFAKYVNPNSENDESSSLGTSSTSSDNLAANSFDIDSQTDDVSIILEYENRAGVINADDDEQLLPHFLLPIHEDVNCQDFVYQNSNEFEMHGIMGDVSTQDMMWSDGTDFQDLGSQQSMVQMQDFGLFSANHDQLRVSENLISDNWRNFDLSAYEFF